MGSTISCPLAELSTEQVADLVASLAPTYEKYRVNIIENKINGDFLSKCSLNELHIKKMLADLNINNTSHQWKLRDELMTVRGYQDALNATSHTSVFNSSFSSDLARHSFDPKASFRGLIGNGGFGHSMTNLAIRSQSIPEIIDLSPEICKQEHDIIRELVGTMKIENVVTMTPRHIMEELFEIQAFDLDEMDIDAKLPFIVEAIGAGSCCC